jgi:hypothetical protein
MAAIQNWIVAATGLQSTYVLWTYYGAGRPSLSISDETRNAFIELTFGTVSEPCHDWVTYDDNPLVFSPLTPGSVVGDDVTITGHGLVSGDGPIQLSSTGTLPAPLQALTNYWVIVIDPNTIQLAATFVETGGNYVGNPITPITLTSTGSGTITLSATDDTVRAGVELERTTQGPREMTLELECFGVEKSGILPLQLLTDVVASIPLNLDALDAAGLGMSELDTTNTQGGVRFMEGHRGSILEPRAQVQINLFTTASLTDFYTYIAELKATINAQSTDGTTLDTIPLDVLSGE